MFSLPLLCGRGDHEVVEGSPLRVYAPSVADFAQARAPRHLPRYAGEEE